MELTELEEPHFSKWVGEENKSYHKPTKNFSDNDVEIVLQNWVSNSKVDSKMKMVIRHGMRSKFRNRLWTVASGGEIKIKSSARHYYEVINELGIQIPSSLPTNIFNSMQSQSPTYLLSPDGEKVLSKILYVLSQAHPDIQFCPLLPPIIAILLHFMDENEAYCCVSAMMESKRHYFDQSQAEVIVMAKTFQDCLKAFMRKSYKHFKASIATSRNIQVTKGTVFFPLWISWIFNNLDFWTLVYITDNYLVQGPKILIRVGLVLFSHFREWLIGKQTSHSDNMEVLYKQFIGETKIGGYKLLEEAFKILNLSKSKIASLRTKNRTLVEERLLEIPFDNDAVKVPTLLRIQGSDLLTDEQWEKVALWLPEKLQIKHPHCLFSTQNDGFSIGTLYKKCEEEDITILLVKTSKGEILGAFCTSPWNERTQGPKNLSYFGTGEMFVFSVLPQCHIYRWNVTDDDGNDYFMAGDSTCLMIGGGGDSALWLDGDLYHGHTGISKTFNNQPLSSEQDFEVVRVEVLGFKS